MILTIDQWVWIYNHQKMATYSIMLVYFAVFVLIPSLFLEISMALRAGMFVFGAFGFLTVDMGMREYAKAAHFMKSHPDIVGAQK